MLKRLIPVAALLLLLSGCGVENAVETTVETVTTEPTQPVGYYLPNSEIEQHTDGAVRQYLLPEPVCPWLGTMGENLVLVAEGAHQELLVLQGAEAVPVNRVQLPDSVCPGRGDFRVTRHGVTYYDADAGAVIYLDPQLKETKRIPLPEDCISWPMISQDGSQIFYSTGTKIFAIDLGQGITRPVRTFSCEQARLVSCEFDGRLLRCELDTNEGICETVYISTETGETISKEQDVLRLATDETRYFLHRVDGTVEQLLVGTWNSEPMVLTGMEGELNPALQLNGMVSWTSEEDGLRLEFRQLHIEQDASGKLTPDGSVLLPGWGEPSVFMDHDGSLWVLAPDRQTDELSLLRWDIGKTPIEATQTCIAPLYTVDAPDEAGLQTCQERADGLNKTHGVRIRIWKEAALYSNTEVLEAEYHPKAIHAVLDDLEPVLNLFPEKFLANCVSDRIRICIVRTVDGEVKGTQYWNDGDAFIVLPAGGDIQNDFLKGLGYLVDSHVLGNSPNYDYWNETNPEGFVYGDSATYSPDYLTGETRAFVDEAGMTSVVEDRSGLFREAMRPDNGEMFQSFVMQEKLRQMCLAIRNAWRLERKTDIYAWEQYLQESIAYQG